MRMERETESVAEWRGRRLKVSGKQDGKVGRH